jgi:hypothetical protein
MKVVELKTGQTYEGGILKRRHPTEGHCFMFFVYQDLPGRGRTRVLMHPGALKHYKVTWGTTAELLQLERVGLAQRFASAAKP